jgi:uncharacterized integral membrane protein
MAKLKLVILIILAAVLVDFALENSQPSVVIKLFKFQLAEIPVYLLAYISLALGLGIGWIAHSSRIRRKRREVQATATASAQERQESQAGHANNQAQ